MQYRTEARYDGTAPRYDATYGTPQRPRCCAVSVRRWMLLPRGISTVAEVCSRPGQRDAVHHNSPVKAKKYLMTLVKRNGNVNYSRLSIRYTDPPTGTSQCRTVWDENLTRHEQVGIWRQGARGTAHGNYYEETSGFRGVLANPI